MMNSRNFLSPSLELQKVRALLNTTCQHAAQRGATDDLAYLRTPDTFHLPKTAAATVKTSENGALRWDIMIASTPI